MSELEVLLKKYDEFLNSECPWSHFICNGCKLWSTHPLNYCSQCPGRIINKKVTWLEHIRLYKDKNHILDSCISHAHLKNTEYPSNNYWELVEHLRNKLGEIK